MNEDQKYVWDQPHNIQSIVVEWGRKKKCCYLGSFFKGEELVILKKSPWPVGWIWELELYFFSFFLTPYNKRKAILGPIEIEFLWSRSKEGDGEF